MFIRILLPCAALQFGLTSAFADELPNLSRVIVCKLIKDDAERLRCYDRALSEAPADAPSQVTPRRSARLTSSKAAGTFPKENRRPTGRPS
jgi:hypothetical protein